MKIKNLSQQEINLSLTSSKDERLIIKLKPNQVLYAENTNTINKQIIIYEKKNLIYVNREMDKPDYVNYYKAFFESSNNFNLVNKSTINNDEEDEDDEIETFEDLTGFDLVDSFDDDFDPDNTSAKKGRGRPKGTKKTINKLEENSERKGRGRPKGTVKIKNEVIPQGEKKGRGRPKGTVKKDKIDVVVEPKKGRGRPKGSTKIKTIDDQVEQKVTYYAINPENIQNKRGRGRPKGTVKNSLIKQVDEGTKILGRKRGRSRKIN